MFIPVSYGSGLTTVVVTVSDTGVLRAACDSVYNGTPYAPNTDIAVTRGTSITLSTTISVATDIQVTLKGQSYVWKVAPESGLRYVNDLAFKRVTGTMYGKLYRGGTGVDYLQSGTLTSVDSIVASIDYAKKEIWLFGQSATKKISVPDAPVAVLFAPRWNAEEGIPAVYYVVTEKFIYPLTADMELDVPNAYSLSSIGTVLAATGDPIGITLVTATQIHRFNNVLAKLADIGGHSAQVTYLDNIIVGQDAGRLLSVSASTGVSTVLYDAGRPSKYLIDTSSAEFVFAIDLVNRMVISVNLTNNGVVTKHLDNVPSSIAVDNGSVYVGLFDVAQTLRFNAQLVLQETLTTVKTLGLTFDGSALVTTDLYSDAASVTYEEPSDTLAVSAIDVALNVPIEVNVPIPWQRPVFIDVGDAQVTRNGSAFQSGYIAAPDVLVFTFPAVSEYYTSNQLNIMAVRPISVYYRTEAKLFPDVVTLPQQLDAFPKRTYVREFDVAGLTDGFSVEILADSPVLKFSINDAEFSTTGEIRNGDHVVVHGYLTNYITQRETNDIVTVFGRPVSHWVLLSIQLNGAEVKHEAPLENDKYPMQVLRGDTVSTTEPDVSNAEYAESMHGQVALAASIESYSADPNMEQDTLCDAQYCGTYGVRQFENAELYVGTSYIATNDPLGADVGLRSTTANFELNSGTIRTSYVDVNAAYSRQWNTSYSFNQDVYVAAYGNTISVSAQQLRHETYANIMLVPGVYQHVASFEAIDLGTLYQAHTVHHVAFVTTEVLRQVQGTPAISIFGEFDRTVTVHKIQVPWEDALRTHHHPESMDSTADSRLAGSQAEADAVLAVRPFGRREIFSTTGDVRLGSTRQIVDLTTQVRVRENVGDIAMPTPQFIVGHMDSSTTVGDGYFATQTEAETYAESLNLGEDTPPEFFQIEGKWVLLSTPVAQNAVCQPSELPPLLQRRFGYVGGG